MVPQSQAGIQWPSQKARRVLAALHEELLVLERPTEQEPHPAPRWREAARQLIQLRIGWIASVVLALDIQVHRRIVRS